LLNTFEHYAPTSSIGAEIRSLTDPRKEWWQKALNAATGLKIGTYDAELMKLRAMKEAKEEMMADDPRFGEFTRPYIKPGYKEDTKLRADMKLLNKLNKASQKLYRKRVASGLKTT
jgi:hypothetical protein